MRNEAKLRAAVEQVTNAIPRDWGAGDADAVRKVAGEPAAAHRGAPQHPAAHQHAPAKPNVRNEATATLPEPQLAAARLLLSGLRPGHVSADLRIDRHTLLRWRRMPAFQAADPPLPRTPLRRRSARP